MKRVFLVIILFTLILTNCMNNELGDIWAGGDITAKTKDTNLIGKWGPRDTIPDTDTYWNMQGIRILSDSSYYAETTLFSDSIGDDKDAEYIEETVTGDWYTENDVFYIINKMTTRIFYIATSDSTFGAPIRTETNGPSSNSYQYRIDNENSYSRWNGSEWFTYTRIE